MAIGGDEADARAHVVLGLGEQIRRDQPRIAGSVGDDEDFGGARQLVDADRAEHLPLRLVHEGVAGAHDLHHRQARVSVPYAIAAIA